MDFALFSAIFENKKKMKLLHFLIHFSYAPSNKLNEYKLNEAGLLSFFHQAVLLSLTSFIEYFIMAF